ncbi:uncharacterized protein BJ171DRAFT_532223 [Polychytrium aggregatum]|uniref:uncharacterized protein n=1 Tax=Polychytrium aggregatum TaxID=110093 RepID=UPI0022FDD9B3|nr:uncharacterized protein BJ171DRAFT_532223 [Polychytrium aggregatum]KAI9193232.1 hypothetical protein BJ171DRAFT_532223 [Polychytrium aggregatum]
MNYEEQPRDFVGNAQPMSLEPSADGIFAQSPIDGLGDSLLEPHDLKHAAMLDPVSPEPSGLGSHSRNEQPGDDRLFTDGSGRHTGMRAHESASEYDDEVSIQSYNSFRKPVSSRGPAPLVNPGYSSPQFASAGRLEPHILQANGAGQRDVRLRPPPGGVDADPFAVQDSRARAQDSPAGYQPLAALAADRMHTLGSPKVEALSVHTDTAPPQRPSTSNSRIQAPDAREGDDPMLRFAECLEGWTNVLKQSILTDFRTSREALVRQHSQQAETLRTQSSYLIDDLTAQLRNSENVAASYLTMLENKSKLVERMLLYIVYKREKALSVRFFASWKVAYAHRQQVNYGQQLARQQHIRHQQRKALRGWQRVAGIHWKRSVEKKARREAESSMEKLATEYEKRIAELNARIETLTLRLQESDSNRAKQQEDVKKAFMRGLCALNMEAMSVLKTTDDGSSLIAGLMGGAKGDSAEADMSSNLGLSRVSEFAADRSDIRRTQPGPTRSAESAEQDGDRNGRLGRARWLPTRQLPA